MARFVRSSVESMEYGRMEYKSHPVNIDLCTKIVLDRFRCYPDSTGVPCMNFHTLDGKVVTWLYNDIETRDADYNRIIAGE